MNGGMPYLGAITSNRNKGMQTAFQCVQVLTGAYSFTPRKEFKNGACYFWHLPSLLDKLQRLKQV